MTDAGWGDLLPLLAYGRQDRLSVEVHTNKSGNTGEITLTLSHGNARQSLVLHEGDSKKEVAKRLYLLAKAIENDKLWGEAEEPAFEWCDGANPPARGWYTVLYSWSSPEGAFIAPLFYDENRWVANPTLPVIQFAGPFRTAMLAADWGEKNNISW